MNTIEFLEKLEALYPCDDSDENYKTRLSTYANLLDAQIKEAGRKPDFEKTLKHILINYQYRALPNFNFISKSLKYKPELRYTEGKMRGFLVQVGKHLYEFWDYLEPNEKIENIRGFEIVKEIT